MWLLILAVWRRLSRCSIAHKNKQMPARACWERRAQKFRQFRHAKNDLHGGDDMAVSGLRCRAPQHIIVKVFRLNPRGNQLVGGLVLKEPRHKMTQDRVVGSQSRVR
jgi:hypothetical protein